MDLVDISKKEKSRRRRAAQGAGLGTGAVLAGAAGGAGVGSLVVRNERKKSLASLNEAIAASRKGDLKRAVQAGAARAVSGAVVGSALKRALKL